MPETGRTIFRPYTLRAARPEVRLAGRRLSLTGREIEASPPWRAISILGVALMNRSNRIDHIRLTSHPDPTPKFAFRFIGGRRARTSVARSSARFRDLRIAMSLAVTGGRTRSTERLQYPPVRSILSAGRI